MDIRTYGMPLYKFMDGHTLWMKAPGKRAGSYDGAGSCCGRLVPVGPTISAVNSGGSRSHWGHFQAAPRYFN
jgi:hypothetical protein